LTVALALGVVVAILIMYTVRWRLPQRLVSTTALWGQVLARHRGGGRLGVLEHLISLILQLAIALSLVLAAAQPRFSCQSAGGRTVVIVLDRSTSMATLERIEPRIETARRRAVSRLAAAAETDDLAVVLAGGEPEIAVPLGRRPVQASEAISKAEIRLGRGDLARAVSTACMLAAGRPTSLVVVTDGSEPVGTCDGAEIELVRVGSAQANVGITGFSAAAPPRDPGRATAFVKVFNSSTVIAHVDLRLDLDGKLIQVATIDLLPNEAAARTFEGIPFTSGAQLRARLATITFDGGGKDALHEDDVAYEILKAKSVVPIDFVGDSEPMRLALVANPRYRVTQRKDLSEITGSLAVVTGTITRPLPPGRYILVEAKGPGLPFATGASRTDVPVTDWNKDHPVMRRVVASDFSVGQAIRATLPASATQLVWSSETPLAFALATPQLRIVALSFNLTDSNLPLRVGFPVLIYNAVDWLIQSSTDDTDDPRTVPATGPLRVIGPTKTTTVAPVAGHVTVRPAEPGFYRFESAEGKVLGAFGASVLSEGETRVTPVGTAESHAEPRRNAGRLRDREVSAALLFFALSLLMIEWFTFHRRKTL
jgi:hypothetical protein